MDRPETQTRSREKGGMTDDRHGVGRPRRRVAFSPEVTSPDGGQPPSQDAMGTGPGVMDWVPEELGELGTYDGDLLGGGRGGPFGGLLKNFDGDDVPPGKENGGRDDDDDDGLFFDTGVASGLHQTNDDYLPDGGDVIMDLHPFSDQTPTGQRASPSNRRTFENISKHVGGSASESSENQHVDSKPRLNGSSSDEGIMSSNDGGMSSGSSDGQSSRRPGGQRGNSPLSAALKFLYTAASPKMALMSSASEQGSASEGGSRGTGSWALPPRTSQGNARRMRPAGSSSSGERGMSQDEVMSDSAILFDLAENKQKKKTVRTKNNDSDDSGGSAEKNLGPPSTSTLPLKASSQHQKSRSRRRDRSDRSPPTTHLREVPELLAITGNGPGGNNNSNSNNNGGDSSSSNSSCVSSISSTDPSNPNTNGVSTSSSGSRRRRANNDPTSASSGGDMMSLGALSWKAPSLDSGDSSSGSAPSGGQHHSYHQAQRPPKRYHRRSDRHQRLQPRQSTHYRMDDEMECYSDVEGTFHSRYGDIRSAPQDYDMAEAKEPRFDGNDLKCTKEEAKEIAENALIDALHKQESKLEAKQDAPEYVQYYGTHMDTGDDPVPKGPVAPPDAATPKADVVVDEPDDSGSFFLPFYVVIRPLPPTSGTEEPRRSIRRYGKSFAIEEDPPKHEAKVADPPEVTVHVDAVVDELAHRAKPGIIVLGGRKVAPVSATTTTTTTPEKDAGEKKPGLRRNKEMMSLAEAASLLDIHDPHEEHDDDDDFDLEELLAQKTARKPPRRSARPLAPAGVELTAEERVALERERNREHARNTRLRKKAALANLKETVERLTARREQAERGVMEKKARGAVKRACIETFFRYRARAERNPDQWAQVVTEDVELWQPVTPHRSFRPSEVHGTRRLSKGVDALVEDAASLAMLFRSIGRRGSETAKFDRAPRFVFEATIASRDQSEAAIQEAFADSDCVGMHWSMRTLDALDFGAAREVSKHGMLVAKFDKVSCKVCYVEFVFDVQDFGLQIMRALKVDRPEVVPNMTTDDILSDPHEARVITTARRPHVIANCNAAWLDLCGVPQKRDCVGHTLAMIQGDLTDNSRVDDLLDHVAHGRSADTVLVNYKLSGEPFLNYLRVFPLYKDPHSTVYPSDISETPPGMSSPGAPVPGGPTVANLGGPPPGCGGPVPMHPGQYRPAEPDVEAPTHYLGILKDVINDHPSDEAPNVGLTSTPTAIAAAWNFRQQQQYQQQQQQRQATSPPTIGGGPYLYGPPRPPPPQQFSPVPPPPPPPHGPHHTHMAYGRYPGQLVPPGTAPPRPPPPTWYPPVPHLHPDVRLQ